MTTTNIYEANIYEKIQVVKQKLLQANLKKSGENKFSNFKYYELSDFLPTLINLCNEVGLFTRITFTNDFAILTITDTNNINSTIEYSSPLKEINLKGCNEIQALGGVETYSRRYLYMAAFDIVENDMFDSTVGKDTEKKATEKQLAIIKARYKGATMKKLLEVNKIDKIEDLPMSKAGKIIKKLSDIGGKNGTN